MKKYNLSQIMRRAWVLKRLGKTMTEALKMSWAETKKSMYEKKFELKFPELTGTERQIKYANDIMTNLAIDNCIKIKSEAQKWLSKGKSQKAVDKFVDNAMAPLKSILANHTDSKFYIQNFKYARMNDFYNYAKREYQVAVA